MAITSRKIVLKAPAHGASELKCRYDWKCCKLPLNLLPSCSFTPNTFFFAAVTSWHPVCQVSIPNLLSWRCGPALPGETVLLSAIWVPSPEQNCTGSQKYHGPQQGLHATRLVKPTGTISPCVLNLMWGNKLWILKSTEICPYFPGNLQANHRRSPAGWLHCHSFRSYNEIIQQEGLCSSCANNISGAVWSKMEWSKPCFDIQCQEQGGEGHHKIMNQLNIVKFSSLLVWTVG